MSLFPRYGTQGPDFVRSPLDDALATFVAEVGSIMQALVARTGRGQPNPDGSPSKTVIVDVTLEAYNLACAVVDADGVHTDDEILGLVASFGHRLDTQLGLATPSDVRRAGLLTGKRSWLDTPSTLFDLLVAADAKDGSAFAWTYYRQAMALAQAMVAIDMAPSESELRAIDRYRSLLVRTIESRAIARPGTAPIPKGTPNAPAPGASGTGAQTETSSAAQERIPEAPLPPPEPLDDLLAELDELVGLDAVKAEVRLVTALLQVRALRRERGLPTPDSSLHLVFAGNPGTGKTTVARLLARIYRSLGVVTRGHLVETDRAGLVAGFVGQTALKVTEAFDRADGGVLLIDEAYSLVRGGEKDFGREAIDMIVKLIEDRRDRLVVIAAGYPDEMEELISANPGLRSRFPKTITFADYSDDELVRIFESLCKKNRYEPTLAAIDAVRAVFVETPRTKGFGNGRVARNLFETAIGRQATRLMSNASETPASASAPTDSELIALEASDITGTPAAPLSGTTPVAVQENGDSEPGKVTPGR